jgi:hypothetical protein
MSSQKLIHAERCSTINFGLGGQTHLTRGLLKRKRSAISRDRILYLAQSEISLLQKSNGRLVVLIFPITSKSQVRP